MKSRVTHNPGMRFFVLLILLSLAIFGLYRLADFDLFFEAGADSQGDLPAEIARDTELSSKETTFPRRLPAARATSRLPEVLQGFADAGGVILDSRDRSPISNAQVSMACRLSGIGHGTAEWSGSVKSGKNGRFSIPDVPGFAFYSLDVKADGFQGRRLSGRFGGSEIDWGSILLERSASFEIRTIAKSGNGLADIAIYELGWSNRSQRSGFTGAPTQSIFIPSLTRPKWRTDQNGLARITGLAPGTYRFGLFGKSTLAKITEPKTILTGAIVRETVVLETGIPVRVRLLDPAGSPVARAVVRLSSRYTSEVVARTDVEGRVSLGGIPENTRFSLMITSNRFLQRNPSYERHPNPGHDIIVRFVKDYGLALRVELKLPKSGVPPAVA